MRNGISVMIALLFLTIGVTANAQSTGRNAKEADVEYLNQGYSRAISLYKVAIKKTKKLDEKAAILYRVGDSYLKLNMLAEAEEYLGKAITAQYWKVDPSVYLVLGQVQSRMGKFPESIEEFNKYKEKGGDSAMADQLIASAEKSVAEMSDVESRYLVEPEILLNTEYIDYCPVYSSKKGDQIILSSSRPAAVGQEIDPKSDENYMDLFSAQRDRKGKWSTPQPVNTTVNTLANEGAASFNDTYKKMYFTRCSEEDGDGDLRGPCEICQSDKQGKKFGTVEVINMMDRAAQQNDSSNFGHPALSRGESQFMVLSSDIPGGFGGLDLYIVEYDKAGKKWGKPKNLGKSFNTAGDEAFPFIRDNGNLYYASTGEGGLGGMDIYEAATAGDKAWANPDNMGYPINTSADDFGMIFETGGDQGLLCSNRAGGKGKDDIYSFKNPPLVFCLQGVVYDDESGQTLTNTKVIITGSNGTSYDLTTDDNGGFSLCDEEVEAETTYEMSLAKTNYLSGTDTFSTIGLSESTVFAREYFLIAINETTVIDLPEIRYVFNSEKLLVDDQINSPDSLNYLYDVLTANPNIVVNLEAHSDTRGKAPYNLTLSQKRAKEVVRLLVEKGIPSDRMVPTGKGESQPIISESAINAMKTEEEREAAHAKNRRTIATINRTDYTPK